MRTFIHSRYLPMALAGLIAGLVFPVGASATPSTPEIEAVQAEYAAVQAELGKLTDDLSMMVEEYNAINEALAETQDDIVDAEHALAEARTRVADAQATLGDRATQIYKDGGTGIIQVLLGTHSFEDLLVRIDWMTRLSGQDARILEEVSAAKDAVEDLVERLENREQEQRALRDQAESQKAEIELTITRREAYADSLDDEVKQLIAEEEERQRKLAEQRAREAAEAAEAAAAAAQGSAEFPDQDPGAGPGRPEVVANALQYLGVPYVWGGSSPSGFDCSGLAQYVYAEVGISIPRTSREQFRAGTRVPEEALDQLVLGDLVFFGYGGSPDAVHHVGIYCGDGNFIHAPSTGDVVKVSSLADRIASKDDYVGASRF